MKPNDILEWSCPISGKKKRWRVLGCHLGAIGQESIIEVENVTELAGSIPHISPFGMTSLFIPESLLRHLPTVASVT